MNNQEKKLQLRDQPQEDTGFIDKVEIIEGSNLLKEGMFAVLKKLASSLPYEIGITLLIEELKFADGYLHSVYVRHHPSYQYNGDRVGFLLEDFYQHFDVISQDDGEAIRKTEIEGIHKLIAQKENHVQQYKDNPQKLQAQALEIYSRRIESSDVPKNINTDNLANLLGQSNALEQVNSIKGQANMFSDIATIQAQIITESVKELQALMTKLTPFMVERYATTLASTKEAQDSIKKVNDGVATLTLYTGEGVEVYEVKKGADAPPDIPLTLMQKRIVADVELAYFNDESAAYLDVDSVVRRFFDVLAINHKLVDQIFPTERCIVVMVLRESDIDYKDTLWNVIMNKLNKKAFLMIRNGENIHAVYSPIGSHLAAQNLFPSKDVLDRCFLSGKDEIRITVDNLKYSDALDEIDRITLHYKRFLILIAGLQHRLNILGQFYPEKESFDIFFPHFQNKYFRFIHDQDGAGLLAGLPELSLDSYIQSQNRTLAKGSKILCHTYRMIREETAPYCFTYSWRRASYSRDSGTELTRKPVSDFEITTVEQDKDGFFVKIPVTAAYTDRISYAKVAITEDMNDLEYLILDGLSVERLENYISKRQWRVFYLKYMGMFKAAKTYIIEFFEENHSNIQFYLEAVTQIKDCPKSMLEVKEIVIRYLNFFKPKVGQEFILGCLYTLLSESRNQRITRDFSDVLFTKDGQHLKGSQAIVTSVDRSGNSYIYVSMPSDLFLSELSGIEEHYWVYRCPASSLKNRTFKLDKAEIVSLLDYSRDELFLTVIQPELFSFYFERGATERQLVAREGKGVMSYDKIFKSYCEKCKFFDDMQFSKEFIEAFFSNTLTRDLAMKLHARVQDTRQQHQNAVDNDTWHTLKNKTLSLSLPFCIVRDAYNRPAMGRISIENGLVWLDALITRFDEMDENTQEQDSFVLEIDVVKHSFHDFAHGRKNIFIEEVKHEERSHYYRVGCLESQFKHSKKFLSYILRASAYQLVQELGLGSKRPVVQDSIQFCVFDKHYMLNFDSILDKQIRNPNFSDQIIEIGCYTFQEIVYKGKDTHKLVKHLYIGAKPYLDKFIADKQSQISQTFEKLESNMSGEIRWLAYDKDFICSTADFGVYATAKLNGEFGKENTKTLVQIEEHIFGLAL